MQYKHNVISGSNLAFFQKAVITRFFSAKICFKTDKATASYVIMNN